MGFIKEIVDAYNGLVSLCIGLGVTGKQFTKRTQTVHYPRQVVNNLESYRGHIDLVAQDDDPTKPKCITCMMCSTICPSGCIAIERTKEEPVKAEPVKEEAAPADAGGEPKKPAKKPAAPKTPGVFTLNYNTCSLCGLCVQNCPVDSLMFSRDVYIVSQRYEDFEFDLLERMKNRKVRLVPAPDSFVAMVYTPPAPVAPEPTTETAAAEPPAPEPAAQA